MSLATLIGKIVFGVALAAGMAFAGGKFAPRAIGAWEWLDARDDPAALTTLGLKEELNSARLREEVTAALDADEVELAASFFALADQQGLAAPTDLRERYAAATTLSASSARNARDFYNGAIGGEADSGVGLAGVVASDLTGIGDVRDLIREGRHMAAGEPSDTLVMGLAAVGLAMTAATIASVGGALPARAGVTTLRVAAVSGKLATPLRASLVRLVEAAVDREAVGAAAAAAGRLDLAAARTSINAAIRPAGLARLADVAGDLTVIGRRGGVRAARETLTLARDETEIARIAKVAQARGPATRAVLKTLGRGAFVLGAGGLALGSWIMAGVGWLWLALLVVLGFTRRCARAIRWTTRATIRASTKLARAS